MTRIAKAEFELSFAPQFDKIIVNDDLTTAFRETEKLVKEFLDPESSDQQHNPETSPSV